MEENWAIFEFIFDCFYILISAKLQKKNKKKTNCVD